MGEIDEGLERVLHTRPVPQSTAARVRFLVRAAKGSTRQVAQQLGVSQRTVQRWLKDPHVRPKPAALQAIEQAVRAGWQPRVRARVRRAAESGGFMLHTSARFGFASAAGSTDDPRLRQITQHLPGEVARRLFAARDAGADEAQQADILAEGLQEAYFRDAGRRASGLAVEFTGIQWADFEIDR
ncbi:telomere-protecting terminal protein Tpg [Streptomyces sp. NRRL B-24484]|uniref:telomere-protecting terminal protein Tpg n=1 Tax=Streptomyces sp. NRRL B-24484 TaxID=1463833 RepID=UPI0004C0C93E|nr:helix-turn-helix domain-containing protein [Streptomyces sp. NRRL B-24484]